jgi:hypothetical protein
MLSMATATMVFAVIMGSERLTSSSHVKFLQSLKIVFLIFTISCLTGIFFSLARGKFLAKK